MTDFTGTPNSESIAGTSAADNIWGLGGDDTLEGKEGDDFLDGGTGNDVLVNGNAGRDRVFGGAGNDVAVRGGADDDYLVWGDDGDDYVYGDRGNDGDLTLATPTNAVNGNTGNDRVFGGDGNDVVRGGQGDDWVYGDDDPAGVQSNPVATGSDLIFGDLGNDQLYGQGGADTFYFGIESAGIVDTINDWTPTQGDRINLTAFDAQPGSAFATGVITDFGSLTMVQNVGNTDITLPTGQKIVLVNTTVANVLPSYFLGKASIDRRGVDNLQAAAAGEQLNGRESDDTVTGGVGVDNLNGNTGRDRVHGGSGNDTVQGGADDDYLVWGDEGDDYVYGNRGNDGDLTLATPTDAVNGNAGNDRVFGGDGNDVVRGGQGDDFVYGDDDPAGVQSNPVATGNDLIFGDLGNDQLFGQGGADTFYFGIESAGIVDTINDWTPTQGDRINLTAFDAQPGSAFATGVITDFGSLTITQAGADAQISLPTGQKIVLKNTTSTGISPSHFIGKASLDHRGVNNLQANAAGEQLAGREGDDVVLGGIGADHLNGNMGQDRVDGGPGNDIVRGGKDNDIQIWGGDGDDIVYGDLGNDTEVNGNKGKDKVYGGPGIDAVRGGADDDLEVFGEDGDDFVYGDEGNDAHVNGNRGNDHVYGGNGNDVVRGGQDDDSVFGDAGDDMVYGDLGTNVLTGGTGKDMFVIANAFNVQNTITDFDRGQDRIDLTALADLATYEQLVFVQQGANTVIQLSPTNKLIINGQTPAQIKSTDFVGPWSGRKSINLWIPGLLHDRITQDFKANGGANAVSSTLQPVINVAEYRITGFNPQANPGNLIPHKPFQLIDLRSVSVSQVAWRQAGNDTLVDLDTSFGKVLRMMGVNASQVTRANFLTVGQDEQATVNAYLSDWIDQSQVERTAVPPADRFYHDGNRIIYETTPTVISMINKKIPETSTTSLIVRPVADSSELQIVEGFNPANPLHLIDVSEFDVPSMSHLGFEQVGPDAKINFPGRKSLILRDVSVSQLMPQNFIGFRNPSRIEVFVPSSAESVATIRGFDATSRSQLLDLTDYLESPDFSEITTRNDGAGNTILSFSNTPSIVVLEGTVAEMVSAKLIVGPSVKTTLETVTKFEPTGANLTLTYDSIGGTPTADQTRISGYGGQFVGDSGGGVPSFSLAIPSGRFQFDLESLQAEFSDKMNAPALAYLSSQIEGPKDSETYTFIDKLNQIAFELDDSNGLSYSRSVNKFAALAEHSLRNVAKDGFGIFASYSSYAEKRESLLNALLAANVPSSYAEVEAVRGAQEYIILSSLAAKSGEVLGGLAAGPAGVFFGDIAGGALYDFGLNDLVDNRFITKSVDRYLENLSYFSNDAEYFLPTSFVLDDATPEVQAMMLKLPAGGMTYIGEHVFQKDVIDETTIVSTWQSDSPTTDQLSLTGLDPGLIAELTSDELITLMDITGQQTPIGAHVYSNGRFFTRTETSFEPMAATASNLEDIQAGRFSYRDSVGEAITSTATKVIIDVAAIVSDSIGDWYDSLINPQPGQSGTVPSGISRTASQAAGTFLADVVLRGDVDAAMKRAKDSAIRSSIGTITDEIEKKVTAAIGVGNAQTASAFVNDLFSSQQWVGVYSVNFAVDLAKTIGEQLLRGEFDDSFASNVVTQSAIQFGVGQGVQIAGAEIASSMATILPQGLQLTAPSIVPFGFDPITVAASIIITTLLNEYFSEEIAEVATFVGDVGEEVWDFVRDPVNSIKNIFDDPKFSSVNGTDGSDTLYQADGDRVRSDLKDGDDVMFGGDGWGIVLAGLGDDIITHGNPHLLQPILGAAGNGVGELYGEEGSDYIDAEGGNDELHGGGGADALYGGLGNDYLWGGDTQRTYSRNTGVDEADYLDGGLGNDFYTGNAGRDTFVVTLEPGAIDTFLDFRTGEDWIDLSQFRSINDFGDLQIRIENGKTVLVLPGNQKVVLEFFTTSTLVRTDFIFTQYGTPGSDVLLGSDSAEIFNGLEGNDDLRLGGGNDIANGNQGDDTISGGAGDDQLRGGRDNDNITGGEGADALQGDFGNDTLNGNQGNDRVDGGPGIDEVRGGRNDDEVIGGEGDDKLYGDLGNDILLGGPGADTFYISPDAGSTDYLQDFSLDQLDRLTLADFSSFPLVADDVVQVGYDTYVFFPANQRAIIRFADADAVRTHLGIGGSPVIVDDTVPADEAPPVLSGLTASAQVNTVVTTTQPFGSAQLDDADSPDLSGGQMKVAVRSGTGILSLSPVSGSNVAVESNKVQWNGFEVGQLLTASDGKSLTVTFGANATPEVAEDVMNSVLTTSFGASTQFSITISDGDGAQNKTFIRTITRVNAPPIVSGFDSTVTYTENGKPVILDANATIVDPDSVHFRSGTLRVSLAANARSTDRLSILHQGNAAGQIGVSGSAISIGGVRFGTVSGTTSLIVTLNVNATPAAVQAMLRRIAFSNVSDTPSTADRTVRVIVTDGDGGTSVAVSKTIKVLATNDPPSGLLLSNVSIHENKPAGTNVGRFSATDPDSIAPFTYSLVTGNGSADNARFEILGTILKTKAVFDYETKKSYSIRVRVKDSGGAFFDKAFTISVLNQLDGTSGSDAFLLSYTSTTVKVSMAINGGVLISQGTFPLTSHLKLLNLSTNDSVQINGTNGNDVFSLSSTGLFVNNHRLIMSGPAKIILSGGAGNEIYRFDADRTWGPITLVETSTGIDTIDFSSTAASVSLNLAIGTAQVVNSTLSLALGSGRTIENIIGGSGSDQLTGNSLANTLTGNAGNDILNGGAGSDLLIGGLNNDTYLFTTATAAEADRVSEKKDEGIDTLNFAGVNSGVVLNLGTTAIQTVHSNRTLQLNSISAFENAIGGAGSDTLIGNALANRLTGGNGNNILVGLEGRDVLDGGSGRDILIGGLGLDTVTGGAGEDILIAGRTTSDASLTNLNTLRTQWTSAISYATRIANIRAGVGNSIFSLKAKRNVLNDAGEDDMLTSGTGKDWYFRAVDDAITDLFAGEIIDVL